MTLDLLQPGHPLWEKTLHFAECCSWRAGAELAARMQAHAFQEWERVIAASDHGEIIGYCTLTAKDSLADCYDFTPLIGFVFVGEPYRGGRISEQMIRCAMQYAGEIGYQAVYIMSSETGLYEKYGFTKIGDFETVYGTTEQLFRKNMSKQ